MKRKIAIGLVFVAATAVACGSESEPAPTPGTASPTTSAAAASDEQQIRDLLDQEEAAMSGFDFEKMAEFTCTKYREDVKNLPDTMFPPLSEAGTPEELAAKPADALAAALKERFPTASDATINALVDAMIRYDEPAYKAANLEVIRETSTLSIDKVENIKIDGDSATADITSTFTSGNEPPMTDTKSNSFVKEDGEWFDCEKPS